jgi:SET domain-containing protein
VLPQQVQQRLLAISLSDMQDIAKGEELTFDYNFERYGDKPMRCYCGSRNCRKSIGGTQQTYDESQLVGGVWGVPGCQLSRQ